MKRLIIGVAGHIDHGKTALVKALTGFDGDQRAEEIERGITLDISFSHAAFGGANVSFIDVPGHEKLVKNMIAGAFAFDALLLVVSAAEGVKPQTIEHLRIADFLGVKTAIVAIAKTDLANAEQIAATRKEIAELFAAVSIATSEICEVTIKNLASVEALKAAIAALSVADRENLGFFRLYADRAFTIKGTGAVVTGSVLSGELRAGEKVWIADLGKEVAARAIRVQGREAEIARAGDRAAINLKGVEASDLERGVLLTKRGFLRGFKRIGAAARGAIRHNEDAQFFIGAKRANAKVLALKGEFIEIIAETEIFAVFGEKFVLRNANGEIAGGEILLPIGDPLGKDQKIALCESLARRDFAGAFAVLIKAHERGFGLISSYQRFAMPQDKAIAIAKGAAGVFIDEKSLVIYDDRAKKRLARATSEIFIKNRRALLSAKSLVERFGWASENFAASALNELVERGEAVFAENLYRSAKCDVENVAEFAERQIYEVLAAARATPDAPYNIYDALDIDRAVGDTALKALTKSARAVRLEHNLFVTAETLAEMMNALRETIKAEGGVDVQSVKSRFGFSRKYALAYLERLDLYADIRREGDRRVFAGEKK
ncbi:MAG: selenocysteine-specific translation elongation factor [Helicobacteraceae bacterium]|jgi:selenocysteine-specific elongation factor|nr:selenocysteine-specific translation elongation factor [Helicobacteraceae bacterium]